MSFTDAKPSDSKESLLNDILLAAANSNTLAPGLPLRPFAALMVKVGDETANAVSDLKDHITRLNEQNAMLQWWVVFLAIAALVGTFVQTAAALYPLAFARQIADRSAAASPTVAKPQSSSEQPLLVPQPGSSSSRQSPQNR